MTSTTTPLHGPLRRMRASGFSLVELMVAITIGLFISAALGAVFMNTKSTFTAQDSLAQLEDNERLALTLLTSSLQAAGYFPAPDTYTKSKLLPAGTAVPSYGNFGAAGSGIYSTTSGSSDVLATRYSVISSDSQASCLGDTTTSTTPVTFINVFSVGTGNVLQCQVTTITNPGGTTPTASTGVVQPLISGVSSFSVLYGVAVGGTNCDGTATAVTTTTTTPSATCYMTAANVAAGSLWTSVQNARVTINFINPYAGQSGQPATIPWTMTVNVMNSNVS